LFTNTRSAQEEKDLIKEQKRLKIEGIAEEMVNKSISHEEFMSQRKEAGLKVGACKGCKCTN